MGWKTGCGQDLVEKYSWLLMPDDACQQPAGSPHLLLPTASSTQRHVVINNHFNNENNSKYLNANTLQSCLSWRVVPFYYNLYLYSLYFGHKSNQIWQPCTLQSNCWDIGRWWLHNLNKIQLEWTTAVPELWYWIMVVQCILDFTWISVPSLN